MLVEASTEFLKDELKRKGIRPSYHRVKVLKYLHRMQNHPTVDDIFAFLSPEIPSLSKATIYNTLHTFVQAGLVRVISVNGLESRYDIALHNHGHFTCERCGCITNFKIDIDSFPVDDLARFEIREKNIYFNGLCPNCLNQPEGKKE
jgi:Fur family peroxide stress response transcriptional regulator